MAKSIENIRISYQVDVVIECTEPESFENSEEFKEEDGKDIKEYLKEKLKDSLSEAWQYAAKVKSTKVIIK